MQGFDLSQRGGFSLNNFRDIPLNTISHLSTNITIDQDDSNNNNIKEVRVTYTSNKNIVNKGGSPGFRIPFTTQANVEYTISLTAKLIAGDQAFVYCESVKPTVQLVPRSNKIGTDKVSYNINFKAVSDKTYIGILFFNREINYTLLINKFAVSQTGTSFATEGSRGRSSETRSRNKSQRSKSKSPYRGTSKNKIRSLSKSPSKSSCKAICCCEPLRLNPCTKFVAKLGKNSNGGPLNPNNTHFRNLLRLDNEYYSLGFSGEIMIDLCTTISGQVKIVSRATISQLTTRAIVSVAEKLHGCAWIPIGKATNGGLPPGQDYTNILQTSVCFRFIKIQDSTLNTTPPVTPPSEAFNINFIEFRIQCGSGTPFIAVTNSPNVCNGQDHVAITPDASTSVNASISIGPKPSSTGFISAQKPDMMNVGGNCRGANAVDWQMVRTDPTQVASGNLSVIGGGASNTASGVYSVIGGGQSNYAGIGRYSTGNPTPPPSYLYYFGHATVGGGKGNSSTGYCSTVGGGKTNTVFNSFSTVSGGRLNTVSGNDSTIGGGRGNIITTVAGGFNTIGGGLNNIILPIGGGKYSPVSLSGQTICGGTGNSASGGSSTVGGGSNNRALGHNSTISGGYNNRALGQNSTVGGGHYNYAGIAKSYRGKMLVYGHNTVGGGKLNSALGYGSTVGGGRINTASGFISTISGGSYNIAAGLYSIVSGGTSNTAYGFQATVGGGLRNTASGNNSTVGGGRYNTASGYYSTVSGGRYNIAAGNYSWAGGKYAYVKSGHSGAFVWAGSATPYYSPAPNTVVMAGIRGVTTGVANAIPVMIDSAGQLGTMSSSIQYKENVTSVIEELPDRLDALVRLNPVRFNFKSDTTKTPDYGLIAEEVLVHLPELVVHDTEGKIETVKYHLLIPLLLGEVIRLRAEVETSKKMIHNLNHS